MNPVIRDRPSWASHSDTDASTTSHADKILRVKLKVSSLWSRGIDVNGCAPVLQKMIHSLKGKNILFFLGANAPYLLKRTNSQKA